MTYAVVYHSRTGNTAQLAEAIKGVVPPASCVYFGPAAPQALAADTLFVGFWTDKGTCDQATADFLQTLSGKAVFLFGTAGFGGTPDYFQRILKAAEHHLPAGNTMLGSFMCQGRMPAAIKHRYEKMLAEKPGDAQLISFIANFDQAQSHPDAADCAALRDKVLALLPQ